MHFFGSSAPSSGSTSLSGGSGNALSAMDIESSSSSRSNLTGKGTTGCNGESGSNNESNSSGIAIHLYAMEQSDSESSDYDSPTETSSGPSIIKKHQLRQRTCGTGGNSNGNEDANGKIPEEIARTNSKDKDSSLAPDDVGTVVTGAVAGAGTAVNRFLMGPHNFDLNPPTMNVKANIRKHSDFDQLTSSKEIDFYFNDDPQKPSVISSSSSSSSAGGSWGLGTFRTRKEIVLHWMMEMCMLRRDAVVIVLGLTFQWMHSVFTNIAYYYHTQLSAAQRTPLKDIAFDALPKLEGSMWMISEYFVHVMIAVTTVSIVSILVVRWQAPHGRPLYCIPIVRRMLLTLTACQALRCISFLVTTLPGPSRQCLYDVPSDMTRDEMLSGPAHDRGNPMGWVPPTTLHDILWRVDTTGGCGDLMFSSHTIFTMLFVCVTWTYFNWKFLKWLMLLLQVIVVPLILAAHKHYSVDVFTALYVTPLVFEMLRVKIRDLDIHSADMASHYGIQFKVFHLNDASQVVMIMSGKEFYVDLLDIPHDLRKSFANPSTATTSPSDSLGGFEEDFLEFDSTEIDDDVITTVL